MEKGRDDEIPIKIEYRNIVLWMVFTIPNLCDMSLV